MIRKTLLALLLAFSINIVIGQSFTTKKGLNNSTFISLEFNPTVIVVVDSVNHKIDSKKADDIKSAWIEKTIIMKDETTKKMYGNKNGVVFIYIKEEYNDEVLKEIEKTGT